MINPCYVIDEKLKIGLKISLESHNFNHAHSILTIAPKYQDFGIETRYNNKILKETATIYARLKNHCKFKYRIIISASFYNINEEDQRSAELELFNKLNSNNNTTENDIDKIDIKSQLKHQIQNQETKESGWTFDKIISMKIGF